MKRLFMALVLAGLASLATAGATSAQAKYEFKLGFKVLADQIPSVVGQPLENEHWGANGDSLQQTTAGLMAWRKADNWTAFTNGARTWVNGPLGVAERGNNERFDWEAPAPPAVQSPPQAPPTTSVSTAPSPLSAISSYLNWASSSADRLLETWNRLLGLVNQVGTTNGRVLTDSGWNRNMFATLADLKVVGLSLQGYSLVPPEMAAVNDNLASQGRDLVYIADEFSAGLSNADPTRVNNASARIGQMGNKPGEFKRLLDEALQKYLASSSNQVSGAPSNAGQQPVAQASQQPAASSPQVFRGRGRSATPRFTLQKGLAVFKATYIGRSNFVGSPPR